MSEIKRKPPQSRGSESGFHGFGFGSASGRAMALAFVSPLVRVAGAPFSTNTEAPATILDSGPLPSSRYEQQLRSDLTKADRSISCLSCTQ